MKRLVIWVSTLGLAALVGTVLGTFIRQYLEPESVPAPSQAALSTPIAVRVLPSGSPVQASSPLPSPAASPAPVAGAPLARATDIGVPAVAATPTSVPAVTATPTSAPAVAATPTDVPAPAPSPTPTPDPAMVGRTVLDERFADNRTGWPDDPGSAAWLADGAYRLFARRAGQFVAVPAPNTESFRDVIVTGTFRKVGGPPGGGYGLIVRDQGPWPRSGDQQGGRFYVLEAGDRGEVGIWRREEDRWVDLLPWTPAEAVRSGGALNELTVHAIGPRLTLLVNGTVVASVEDSVLEGGAVRVFVGGDFNEVVLKRFVVEVPR